MRKEHVVCRNPRVMNGALVFKDTRVPVEILLKSGLPVTTEVERLEVEGREVYAVSDGLLMVCLKDHVNEVLMRAVVEPEPERFVYLDTAFDGNDQLKTNTVLQMKDHGIEFRTV